MKFGTIKGKRHYVYDSMEEFQEHCPDTNVFFDWRLAKEGDWVMADEDSGIVQLLKVSDSIKHPNDRPNYKHSNGWCRTIVGTFLRNKKTKMDTDFEQHKNRYTFSKTIKNTNSRIKERKKTTNKEKIFATSVATGTNAVMAYMEAFHEDNQEKARKKAVILLKQRRVMSEIDRTAKEIADELGIDHQYILRSLKLLADTSDDQNIALQSLKELGKAIGTLGQPVKRIESGIVGLFQGFSPEQVDSAKRKMLESE